MLRSIDVVPNVATNDSNGEDERATHSSFTDAAARPVVSAENNNDNGVNEKATNVGVDDRRSPGTDRSGAFDAVIHGGGRAASDDGDGGEETDPADDLLTQLSDALLFGKTPKFLSRLMSDVMDSSRWALPSPASDVQRQGDGGVDGGGKGKMEDPSTFNYKDDVIEDTDQIKIGDKFHSHNEAIRSWRQAKMKLSDKYFDFDNEGNVKMEIATYFERSALFLMNDKDVGSAERATNENGEEDAMTLDELITSFTEIEVEDSLTLTSPVDESTIPVVTGNDVAEKVEHKNEEEHVDNDMIVISDGYAGIIVQREIIKSTPSSSPTPAQMIEDVESVETVIQELNNAISSITLTT